MNQDNFNYIWSDDNKDGDLGFVIKAVWEGTLV